MTLPCDDDGGLLHLPSLDNVTLPTTECPFIDHDFDFNT